MTVCARGDVPSCAVVTDRMAQLQTTAWSDLRTVQRKSPKREGLASIGERARPPEMKGNTMDISDTVRRSTWYRRPLGRRVMQDNPPYFTISEPDGLSDSDARRRRSLARAAYLAA